MTNYKELFIRLVKEDSGQDLIEYALIAALIGLGAITSMSTLTNVIKATFTSIGTSLTAAT